MVGFDAEGVFEVGEGVGFYLGPVFVLVEELDDVVGGGGARCG